MNVFFLDLDPISAAHGHCIRHRNKMIVEYAQLLSTAHHVLDDKPIRGIYKQTHTNHPSAVWVRESKTHYDWVLVCAMELCELYRRQNWVQHKTYDILVNLHTYPKAFQGTDRVPPVPPPQCMPDEFKQDDCVQAYRSYMHSKYVEWANRDKPLAIEYYHCFPNWLQPNGFEVQTVM